MRSSSEQLLFRSWVSGSGPVRGFPVNKFEQVLLGGVRQGRGCARFGEFWLFFTEQVFTLPLCYEKSNQGAQEFAQKSAKRARPREQTDIYFHMPGMWALIISRVTKGFRFFYFWDINGNAFEFKLNSCI